MRHQIAEKASRALLLVPLSLCVCVSKRARDPASKRVAFNKHFQTGSTRDTGADADTNTYTNTKTQCTFLQCIDFVHVCVCVCLLPLLASVYLSHIYTFICICMCAREYFGIQTHHAKIRIGFWLPVAWMSSAETLRLFYDWVDNGGRGLTMRATLQTQIKDNCNCLSICPSPPSGCLLVC